jgi:hypothetical protein
MSKLKLPERQPETKGNNVNVAPGKIIDREAYLEKLNNEILELKSKIQTV